MNLCFKKKKFVLKTKTNLHSVHQKTSKGKKNEKKRNEQRRRHAYVLDDEVSGGGIRRCR